ncbi:MAG: DUF3459 domain-containing protein, partial [Planctomycetota bacterium]
WAEAVPAVRAAADRPLLMLAEGARADHFEAGFDLTFGWRFFYGLKPAIMGGGPAREIARAHQEEYANVPEGKHVLRWTTNHDETAYDAPPPVLFGSLAASQAAYAAMIVYGGVPLIYSGQEVGTPANTPVLDRLPIDWTLNPGLPDWYASMIEVRRSHDAIKSGAITDRSSTDALVVARTLGDERVLAMVNLRSQTVTAPLPDAWRSDWVDLATDTPTALQSDRSLAPHEAAFFRLNRWPNFVVAGALQTEQGDPADWDPANSSLVMVRDGGRFSVEARNLADRTRYPFEVLTDRGEPPADAGDPRIAANVHAVGDADGRVRITVDDTQTNNKGGPVAWIDTDAAPLHVVGNFMDEAGGAADWNPADPSFAMTPLGQGRYVWEGTLSAPGEYAFKATYGEGWNDQVGTDGFNDNALTRAFTTSTPNQDARLFIDLREQTLEAWVGPCPFDRDANLRLDVFDLLNLLELVDLGVPGIDVIDFIRGLDSGCN